MSDDEADRTAFPYDDPAEVELRRMLERSYDRELTRRDAIDGALGAPAALTPILATAWIVILAGVVDTQAWPFPTTAVVILAGALIAGAFLIAKATHDFLRASRSNYAVTPPATEIFVRFRKLSTQDVRAFFDDYLHALAGAAANNARENARRTQSLNDGYRAVERALVAMAGAGLVLIIIRV